LFLVNICVIKHDIKFIFQKCNRFIITFYLIFAKSAYHGGIQWVSRYLQKQQANVLKGVCLLFSVEAEQPVCFSSSNENITSSGLDGLTTWFYSLGIAFYQGLLVCCLVGRLALGVPFPRLRLCSAFFAFSRSFSTYSWVLSIEVPPLRQNRCSRGFSSYHVTISGKALFQSKEDCFCKRGEVIMGGERDISPNT